MRGMGGTLLALLPLERKGSWLISASGRWQMQYVHGPLDWPKGDREYFEVETACRERLLVSRPRGERGMRELRLDSFLRAPAARQPA